MSALSKPSAAGSSIRAPRAEQTRQKLLDAGVFLFAQDGYNATSTRQIETQAGVQRNLMSYHFGSKEAFWKECMRRLFKRMTTKLEPAVTQSRDIEPAERIRFLIRQFVRASAANPEINRIMFDEGRRNDWRLAWIVENYGRDFYQAVSQVYEQGRRENAVAHIPLIQFYYILVSSASIFSMAPECLLLSGEDPHSDTMVDAQADAIATLLTGSHQDSG